MADDVDDEDGGWLVRREDGDDLWEPRDDPDFWDSSTGERAYQGNEDGLCWRLITSDGFRYEGDCNGTPIPRRDVALIVAFEVAPSRVAKKLEHLHKTVAGWSKITADGWTIEPIPEKKSDG